ncbi:MAG: deaminase [Patescibacteria group bacterium]
MRTLVAYVPVLHEGYRRYFENHEGAKELLLIGSELTQDFKPITKDIRQLDAGLMRTAIESLDLFDRVGVLGVEEARALNEEGRELILTDEDISRHVAETYFPKSICTFESIFLRWDKHNALAERPIVPDEMIVRTDLHRHLLAKAEADSTKSSDIWRRVGALVARNGESLLIAHNQHLPSEHTPYVNGDPRNNFSKGEYIEYSSAIHAEAAVIAEAAKRGVMLEGTDMYVTVFPCPPCAKLIAQAGIQNLYCGGGYGVLDGESILKNAGVRILFVE